MTQKAIGSFSFAVSFTLLFASGCAEQSQDCKSLEPSNFEEARQVAIADLVKRVRRSKDDESQRLRLARSVNVYSLVANGDSSFVERFILPDRYLTKYVVRLWMKLGETEFYAETLHIKYCGRVLSAAD
jgi:hypothetical protein